MKAIILAAGQGTRLRPLTWKLSKCLVEVCGRSLLGYQLDALERAGVRSCVVVVGYRGEQVRREAESHGGAMEMTFVRNERYSATNNLYSLWLARAHMRDDILLLEGDLLFDPQLLSSLLDDPRPDVAVVDTFTPLMDGTVVQAMGRTAGRMVLKAHQGPGFDYRGVLKTVNIYKLSRATLQLHYLPVLDRYVAQGWTNSFYEAALADLLSQGAMRLGVHHVGNARWAEIDDLEDLKRAERLFGSRVPELAIAGWGETP